MCTDQDLWIVDKFPKFKKHSEINYHRLRLRLMVITLRDRQFEYTKTTFTNPLTHVLLSSSCTISSHVTTPRLGDTFLWESLPTLSFRHESFSIIGTINDQARILLQQKETRSLNTLLILNLVRFFVHSRGIKIIQSIPKNHPTTMKTTSSTNNKWINTRVWQTTL